MSKYIVASSKAWFTKFNKSDQYKKLNIIEISNKKDLNINNLKKINPRYIFFPHWNWKVNSEIFNNFECVVFHTSPLPYGRGGSPIQNMIIRNIKKSPVCAIRMTEIIDGGPIYESKNISLKGTISEIFFRIAKVIEQIIIRICKNNPKPTAQKGDIILFNRLKNTDNELLFTYSLKEIYNRIRMVDGEGYQKAYISFGDYRLDFSESYMANNELYAKVKFYKSDN